MELLLQRSSDALGPTLGSTSAPTRFHGQHHHGQVVFIRVPSAFFLSRTKTWRWLRAERPLPDGSTLPRLPHILPSPNTQRPRHWPTLTAEALASLCCTPLVPAADPLARAGPPARQPVPTRARGLAGSKDGSRRRPVPPVETRG